MITHEDIKVIISLKVRCNKEVRKYLNDYITRQEKKEERAKKIEELLELYRSKGMHMEDFYTYGSLRGSPKVLDNLRSVREEIEVLEKELEK